MSFFVQAWAEDAFVADVYERTTLVYLSHKTPNKDGSGSYPSVPSMAKFGICSARQVSRAIKAMLERGLIAEGDQSLAAHIPAHLRPKVYDLMVPYEWYSASQRREVDEERARQGRPPMTLEERPWIKPCPPRRKQRADTGKSKPNKPADDALSSEDGEA